MMLSENQLSDKEIVKRKGEEVVVDVEIYPNYFLICFEFIKGGKVFFDSRLTPIEKWNNKKLIWLLQNFVIYTFNGIKFDLPVILYYLNVSNNILDIYSAAQELINDTYYVKFYKKYNIAWGQYKINHVDLLEVSFGKSSLKMYAGRLHAPYMQDLPYDFWKELTNEEKKNVLDYCWNDTQNTKILKENLQKQLDLRVAMGKDYATDLRSKSDAQIAEAVIAKELHWKYGVDCQKPDTSKFGESYSFKYKTPKDIKFETEELNNVLQIIQNADFRLTEFHKLKMPEEISKLNIKIGKTTYKLGMGGLHSTENLMYYDQDDQYMMVDRDVASYYPSIILNQKLYPKQLTSNFIDVYKNIVDRRLEAKAKGDKTVADTLKIVINGSFGKFGSVYSILFAPELLIQTTISGQLYLLMAIERMEQNGFSVISGNTDGFVTRFKKERKNEFDSIIKQWELDTRFDTEEVEYIKYFGRDVNNYIAVKRNGEVKLKGCFGETGLSKNPAGKIIYEAVTKFISEGCDIDDTIRTCSDIRKFVFVRKVEGGALDQDNNKVGKVIRWYIRKGEFLPLKYVKSNNKVPKSDGASTIMDLSVDFPQDIDYHWYSSEAKKILNAWFGKVEQLELF